MFLGAVFEREIAFAPRSQGLFLARAIYCGLLLAIIATCWLVVTGSQSITSAGDTARFGATLMRILAPLQLALAMLAAALTSAVAVSSEKDRRTLELLLISRLSDFELVIGKLAASLVRVSLLLFSALPIFAIAALFGGVTGGQLARLFAVTMAASLAAASIATAVAFWKETTFQSLAFTTFVLVAWMAAGEVAMGWYGASAGLASPARAVFAAIEPFQSQSLPAFFGICTAIVLISNAIAVAQVRRWNRACESRRAIAVALSTVAFLFVGVATAMRIMVAFGGSFELQLAPFLAIIVGGAIGLYAALSARNPSSAIGWAAALLPALTFVAITGFLQGNSLQVLLVVTAAYGFATLAMLVPAIGAFDLLTGRTTTGE